MGGSIAILIAILMFGVLITIHEFGHFIVARLCHITVNEFSIGMGPAIYKKQGKNTLFSLRIFPIGGYCALEGEDGGDPLPGSFGFAPLRHRAAVLLAGSLMNIVLGFIISICLAAGAGNLVSTTVVKFEPNAASQSAGIMAGDEIAKVGNKKTNIGSDVSYALIDAGGKPVNITVRRGGETLLFENVALKAVSTEGVTISAADFYLKIAEKNPISILKHGVLKAASFCEMIWKSIYSLFTGGVNISDLSGPVGTTAAIGNAASAGFSVLMMFMTFISINLGIFNLLPLPALDGGRLLLLGVEKVRGRKLPAKVEGMITFVGFSLLMLLMLFVTVGDIFKLAG